MPRPSWAVSGDYWTQQQSTVLIYRGRWNYRYPGSPVWVECLEARSAEACQWLFDIYLLVIQEIVVCRSYSIGWVGGCILYSKFVFYELKCSLFSYGVDHRLYGTCSSDPGAAFDITRTLDIFVQRCFETNKPPPQIGSGVKLRCYRE